MRQHLFAALVAIGLLATSSCASDNNDSATTAKPSEVSDAPVGSDDSSASSTPPATGDSKVARVGAILSESGIYSTLGPPEHNAMTMALEALNKKGFDVAGTHYTMEIVFADDKSDAATSGVTAVVMAVLFCVHVVLGL